ncbi:hypothetical protein CAPTEDRAFT_202341 [Capitella teleta]|uniref:Fibrinogen C-terminal domain-containing protein n=1 Tax=Capitella teleta TaxID=283909 RepID=R7TUL2_CAPTE|nr:hypothetical protein CAPTEDRAFT_202341 [Capitella teleta]|eukprot:ELT97608.1 hypothetical protein CAPTEDRAFT_202341 [Capitella teleta]
MDTAGGGWLVFQRRKDGSVDFDRVWSKYAQGFGLLRTEFWLGNDLLHLLTASRNVQLRVDMKKFDGAAGYEQYDSFHVGDAASKYRLETASFSGSNSLTYSSGMMFSTRDSDNDNNTRRFCSQQFGGAWWFKNCHMSNLNGKYYLSPETTPYANGVSWFTFSGNRSSLQYSDMKLRSPSIL